MKYTSFFTMTEVDRTTTAEKQDLFLEFGNFTNTDWSVLALLALQTTQKQFTAYEFVCDQCYRQR